MATSNRLASTYQPTELYECVYNPLVMPLKWQLHYFTPRTTRTKKWMARFFVEHYSIDDTNDSHFGKLHSEHRTKCVFDVATERLRKKPDLSCFFFLSLVCAIYIYMQFLHKEIFGFFSHSLRCHNACKRNVSNKIRRKYSNIFLSLFLAISLVVFATESELFCQFVWIKFH